MNTLSWKCRQAKRSRFVRPGNASALVETPHGDGSDMAPQMLGQGSGGLQPGGQSGGALAPQPRDIHVPVPNNTCARVCVGACACVHTQKIDRPVSVVNNSKAKDPAMELPEGSSPGDQTQTPHSLGISATMPPPTPLLAGSPTRKAKSPAES